MKQIATILLILASTAASAQQQPNPVQQAIDQRVRTQIGDLVINQAALVVQLEVTAEALTRAQARIRELEAKLPKEPTQ